jgi:crotonobetainyl-CoA:carnitine CoA-transferase CaiB-like acyl-CoA transferase
MRVEARKRLIPELVALFKSLDAAEIERRFTTAGLPFASVGRPEDLFDDPQLNANGSLGATTLPGGVQTKLPKLPVRIDGEAFAVRSDPPEAGEHTRAILNALNRGQI